MSTSFGDVTPGEPVPGEGEEIPAELEPDPIVEDVFDPAIPDPVPGEMAVPQRQSADGTWWELAPTNTGGSKWVKMTPQPS